MTLDAFDTGKHIFASHVDIQHTEEWAPQALKGGKHEHEPKYRGSGTHTPSQPFPPDTLVLSSKYSAK